MKEVYKTLAELLKKPQGELAIQVGEKLNEVNETINQLSIDALDLKPGDKVLEIGMANGYFVRYLFAKQNNITYTGCDYSVKMVYEANRINEELVKQEKAEFILADAAELPFAEQVFDKIMVVATLYYFDKLEDVFSEFRRVLKPHGQLLVSIRPRSVMELFGTSDFSDHMFSREELRELISSQGFGILSEQEHQEPDIKMLEEYVPATSIIVVAEKLRE
jgi:ubiquinone/menaquinone biosynthesis C-methylase UbiE